MSDLQALGRQALIDELLEDLPPEQADNEITAKQFAVARPNFTYENALKFLVTKMNKGELIRRKVVPTEGGVPQYAYRKPEID